MDDPGEFPFDDAFFDNLRREGHAAFAAEDFLKAFATLRRAIMLTALQWFGEAGVTFNPPEDDQKDASLAISFAIAANREIEERGEGASIKLLIAAEGLNVLANLHATLDRPMLATPDEVGGRLPELIVLGSDMGRVDGLMIQIRLGLLERLSALDLDRERRRYGAMKTKAAKATVKEGALGEAMRVLGRNPRSATRSWRSRSVTR